MFTWKEWMTHCSRYMEISMRRCTPTVFRLTSFSARAGEFRWSSLTAESSGSYGYASYLSPLEVFRIGRDGG